MGTGVSSGLGCPLECHIDLSWWRHLYPFAVKPFLDRVPAHPDFDLGHAYLLLVAWSVQR